MVETTNREVAMILSTMEFRGYTLVVLGKTVQDNCEELRSTLVHSGLTAFEAETLLEDSLGNCNHFEIMQNQVLWT
jgi:hypothetical protein